MSELKRVKFGKDGQLFVGDHQPTVMTGNNVKWDDDVKYLKMLMYSMAVADYLDNVGDIEFNVCNGLDKSSIISGAYLFLGKPY